VLFSFLAEQRDAEGTAELRPPGVEDDRDHDEDDDEELAGSETEHRGERYSIVGVMDVVVGLGANLGDRRSTLAASVAALARHGTIQAVSALYETEPVGPPQPAYLNAAVRGHFPLSPGDLLQALLGIEQGLGRVRDVRWGPRIVDLDILWIQGLAVSEESLVVPHARLRERRFALVPLLDVAPDARDPVSGEPLAVWLSSLADGGVVAIAGPDWWRPVNARASW
jgi:2-amino-4-hydroxy-6-hydroxymethyldihydropteridine diphosphokinase